VVSGSGEEPIAPCLAYTCALCDRPPKIQITDGAVQVQDPCPYPNGITTTITLSVPSGKMVVDDDLRSVYDWDREGLASYGTALGQAQVVEAMAAIGCAYGPVGNSCPGLYRTAPDTYVIAIPGYGDGAPSLRDESCLASICTGLWAYSIADAGHWEERGGDPHVPGWSGTIVDVTPGTYRFTHTLGARIVDADGTAPQIFARVERVD